MQRKGLLALVIVCVLLLNTGFSLAAKRRSGGADIPAPANVEYRLVGSVYEVSNDGGEWHEFAVVQDGEIVITDYTYITYSHDYPVVYESNPELFEVKEYPDEGVVEIYPLVLPSDVLQEGYVRFEDEHVTELAILPATD